MLLPALAAVAVVAYLLGGNEPDDLPGADPIPPGVPEGPTKKKRTRKKK